MNGRPITAREHEILTLVAGGCTNSRVAEHLHLAEETVKEHVRSACRKLGARNRTHAVANAIRKGLL